MHLTKLERETIIVFNDAEESASVYTASPTIARRLERRLARKPDKVSACGSEWVVPRLWVVLPRLRVKRPSNRGNLGNLRPKAPIEEPR